MKRPIHFVIAPTKPDSGSTRMRSYQLSDIIRQSGVLRGADIYVSQAGMFRDSVLVLNKNAMETVCAEQLNQLRKFGNVLIADPLDGSFEPEFLSLFDAVLVASYTQLSRYTQWLHIPVAYVGHHVDTRIGEVHTPQASLCMGYFGELVHAKFIDELAGHVRFVATDTRKSQDTSWMAQLAKANAHYCIRPKGPETIFKPFTKGFIASRCGAPVLLDAADSEARYFLPQDYPYFTSAHSATEVKEAILRMADDFGSSVWRAAVDMMRQMSQQCSKANIARQFHQVITTVLA